MRWQVKCLVDNVKAIMPLQDQLRQMKRNLYGYEPNIGVDGDTIAQGLDQVQMLQPVLDLSSARILELGSGWKPLIPLIFSLAGTKQVVMTDLTRLLHSSSLNAALEMLRVRKDLILQRLGKTSDEFERFIEAGKGDDLDKSLERLRMQYLAPCDMRKTSLPSGSIDAMVSRAVLEHIPPEVIRDIFTEAARIIRPGGMTLHIIDNSDHWEHVDKSISRVNFLKFSDGFFRFTCVNSFNYQNRTRHSEYRAMLQNAGFKIELDQPSIDSRSREVLETFPLAPRFRSFSKDDLATVNSVFLARRP